MTFSKWLETFLSEKGVDLEETLTVQGASGANWIPVSALVDAMKRTSAREQTGIKAMLVKIDFANGNVRHYLTHLAQAVAL